MKPQCDIDTLEHFEFIRKYCRTAKSDKAEAELADAVLKHFFTTEVGQLLLENYVWDEWTEKTVDTAYGNGPLLSERLQQIVGALMKAKNPGLTRKPEPVVVQRPRDAQGRFVAGEQPQIVVEATPIPTELLDFRDAYLAAQAADLRFAHAKGIVLGGKRYTGPEFEAKVQEATLAGLV